MFKITCLFIVLILIVSLGGCSSYTNEPPQITSTGQTEATGGIFYSYRVTFTDPDTVDDTVMFANYPTWLRPASDSIYGTPPDGPGDTSFQAIVYDGNAADTIAVSIRMIPSMVVYGDSRTGHDVHQLIVDSLMTVKPSAVFHTGDLVNDGRLAGDWAIFNDITADMRANTEFFPSLGNHEHQSQLYFDNFELPNNEQWYSVDRNYVHFICLNSCIETDTASEQYQWLQNDLAGISDTIRFVVAYFHHPPYSTGPHTEDEMGLRETWIPLFDQYSVDIVFNGHDHHYERSYCGGRFYIVSGGGGAPMRDQARQDPCSQLYLKKYHYCKLSVVDNRMIVKVFSIDEGQLDEFVIDKTPIPVDSPRS